MRRKENAANRRQPWMPGLGIVLAIAGIIGAGAFLALRDQQNSSGIPKGPPNTPQSSSAPLLSENPTFTKHIAPVVFEHCSGCHRPGQSAPFPLLTYSDLKKHAKDIVTVVNRRYMPPWPPAKGHGDFLGDRSLSDQQIAMINTWVAKGCVEGSQSDLPPPPEWKSDWHLGTPDLIVTMPETYSLYPDGPDVYRNFVIPVPVQNPKYVRAIEFRPGNAKVVHHALVKLDRRKEGRRRDRLDPEVGFAGMMLPSETGHFLGWQPGRLPAPVPEGLAWELRPGDDLVVQTHMSPSGKQEQVQSSIGLYFTDQPPTATPFRLLLTSITMDIPPGTADYAVSDSYILPVDVDVLAILPHLHYLGKEISASAILPNGDIAPLVLIKEWDFNWQSDYRYKTPLSLPKGTRLSIKFTFDNSTNNTRNPHHPPRRVRYGVESTDEMAEFWLQVLPRRKEDLPALAADYEKYAQRRFLEGNLTNARNNPANAAAQSTVGLIYVAQRRIAEAEKHLRAAIAADPNHAPGHYGLGLVLRQTRRLPEAETAFAAAARLDPSDPRPHSNLGFIAIENRDFNLARSRFLQALQIDPADPLARAGLEQLTKAPPR